MNLRFLPFLLFLHLAARAQKTPTGPDLPSPEAFVNAIAPTLVDSGLDHYYLVAGTDSCRFLKYNYDEWVKYHLVEPVPFQELNDLAEKVYLSRYPYFWKQAHLHKAICITSHQADSILNAQKNFVYSFSLPQITDDGQYAVIDLNLVCGDRCGKGVTCIFRLTARGDWKLVGENTNWEYH
ncbi:MAG TPA: hypothetical protein VGQ51_13995 [Puia sp.]|nr:hypothetical protein [Puia sp.]